jgi:serine/threonine protein kinase
MTKYGYGRDNELFYIFNGLKKQIVMECCECGSLDDIFRLRKRPLTENECKAAIASTLLALYHIHSLRCLHRVSIAMQMTYQ